MASEVENLLTQFNIDPQNRKIRDYYEADNLWRTLKIERDENSHSAFIAWLLGTETTRENSPMLNFLNLIVRCKKDRVEVDKGYNKLKKAILLGAIKFDKVNITPEMVVSKISKIRYNDRLDIYISCNISGVEDYYDKLEIIIENKIDSKEGGTKLNELKEPSDYEKQYKKKSQTERYYFACSTENLRQDKLSNTIQLFVFLTPQEEEPKNEHFIKITYQDVVDYIIQPLLNRDDLNPHTAFVLKEYLRTLGNPYNNKITMATTQEENELLKEFYTRNEDLFRRALEVMRESAPEEEKQNYTQMLESITKNKQSKRRFSINGTDSYKMYEIVAKFVGYLLNIGKSIEEIDGIIQQYTQENKCHVSCHEEKIRPQKKKNYEFTYNGTTYYVTKQWGYDKDSDKNFAGFMKNVNDAYDEFQIEEIKQ